MKPRYEYVIVKTVGWGNTDTYFMERRYKIEWYVKNHGLAPDTSNYLATGLSYKQAKAMMKLFKEQ